MEIQDVFCRDGAQGARTCVESKSKRVAMAGKRKRKWGLRSSCGSLERPQKGKGKGQEGQEEVEKRHRGDVDWRDEPWEYKNDAYEALSELQVA